LERTERAGRKWLKNFLCHHPQISVRTPEGLSLSRARGFMPESVAQFFEEGIEEDVVYEPCQG
jgi:hypothetical protein